MTRADAYASLARMLEYPLQKAVLEKARQVAGAYLAEHRQAGLLAAFAERTRDASLAELQEEYVATFDFTPATAPYLGHHLFGDNQKKAAFQIELKQEYQRTGFAFAGDEPPDHLPTVLAFLSHSACTRDDAARQAFLAAAVLPGLERLAGAFPDRQASPWRPVIEAARWLCAADCKEANPC